MPSIPIRCRKSGVDAATKKAIMLVADEALDRAACNCSAIMPDDIIRESRPEARSSGTAAKNRRRSR
jgi:hypothetical protein